MSKVFSPTAGVIVARDQDIKIVQAYADDQKRPDIALSLKMNIRTLDGRTERLKRRYGVKTMAGAVYLFYKNGLIE